MDELPQIARLLDGSNWVEMIDDNGRVLPRIRARRGVVTYSEEGLPIGADLIEMQPPAEFPIHIHEGCHILYIISGTGWAQIGPHRYPVEATESTVIPFKTPHKMGCDANSSDPFVFLVVSYPHNDIGGTRRLSVTNPITAHRPL